MAIEIKEMLIKTSVESAGHRGDQTLGEDELLKLKNDIVKECIEKFKEHLNRQNQR